ncbi:MAG: hypothetical protein O9264_02145 [Leptospira sp.]|nr:hypothetical protein [Leptospira sp.]
MSAVFDFFEKIQKQIFDLQNSIQQFQQSWEKFQKFWDLFFTIVPWEVLLLLVFSVIFLSLFNSISPNTPKANLTVSVILLSSLWVYFWGLFSDTVNFSKIVISALYILGPLHALGLATFGYKYYRKWKLSKIRIEPRDWQEALNSLSRDYNQMMAVCYDKSQTILENKNEISQKIVSLEESILGIKSILEKK